MKKLISLLLTIIMAASVLVFAVPSAAADLDTSATFEVTSAAGYQNYEVTVDLNIKQNDGLFSMWFLLYHDEQLILRDVQFNDTLSELGEFSEITKMNQQMSEFNTESTVYPSGRAFENMKNYNINTNGLCYEVLYYEAYSIDEDVTFTGTAATFTFQIEGIAEDGDYVVGIMPDFKNFINNSEDYVDIKWSNGNVTVGTDKVPDTTAAIIGSDDTVDPSEVTEAPETKGYEDYQTETGGKDTATPETIIGEDGKTYVVNEDGETVEYVPEKSPDESLDVVTAEAVTETDVDGKAEAKQSSTISLFGKEIPLIYFIGACLLVLVAIAIILLVIISKTRKAETEDIDDYKEPKKIKDVKDKTETETAAAIEEFEEVAEDFKEDAETEIDEVSEKAEEIAEDIKDETTEAAEDVKDAVEDVKDEASDAFEKAEDAVNEVKDEIADAAEDVKDAVEDEIEKHIDE